jgi:hypothetical protein
LYFLSHKVIKSMVIKPCGFRLSNFRLYRLLLCFLYFSTF